MQRKKQLLLLGLVSLTCHPVEKPAPHQPFVPNVQAETQPAEEVAPLRSTPSSALAFVPRGAEEEALARRILLELDARDYSTRGTVRYDAASESWQDFALPGDPRVIALATAPKGDLYALTERQLFHSTNKGASWAPASTLTVKPSALWIDPRGALLVSGTSGELSRSRDQGKTWEPLKTGATPLRAFWGDDKASFAVTTDGKLLRTIDQGDSWAPVKVSTKERLNAVWGNDGALYVAGNNGAALRSADRGVTWSALQTGTTDAILSVLEYQEHAYLAGDDLLLLRCEDKACETLSSFDSFMSEQAIPGYVDYTRVMEELREERPSLTKLAASKDGLWVAGEQGVVFFLEDPAQLNALDEDELLKPADGEDVVELFVTPDGDAYLVSAQEAFYGLEVAKRGIAARDAGLIREGFSALLFEEVWATSAGYAYGGLLSAPPASDAADYFKDAVDQLAEQDATDKEQEALLWSFLGQYTTDKDLSQFAYTYSQQLAPSETVAERSKALGVCLAKVTTPNKKAAPIKGWLPLWKQIRGINETEELEPTPPKNNKEAQDELCPGCTAGGGALLRQVNANSSEEDYESNYEEEIYHVIFVSAKKQLSGFLSVATNFSPGGRVLEASPLQVVESSTETMIHLTITQEQLVYPDQLPQKIGEKITDLFYDIASQTLVLQIEREGIAPHKDDDTFLFLAKVSVDGDEVRVTGGGCDKSISLKKK